MGTLRLTAHRNADWRQPFSVVDADGQALSLSGAAIRAQVRNRLGITVLSLSLGSGLTVTDTANGEFDLEVDQTTMAGLQPGPHDMDILVEIDGLRLVAGSGIVNVRDGVTVWA